MTVSDIGIRRSAVLLVKEHGEEAWTEAVVRFFEIKERGDTEGMAVWSERRPGDL